MCLGGGGGGGAETDLSYEMAQYLLYFSHSPSPHLSFPPIYRCPGDGEEQYVTTSLGTSHGAGRRPGQCPGPDETTQR